MKKVFTFLFGFIGWFIIIYVILFFITFSLYNGCIENGYGVASCKDNWATKVVTYPFISFFK